MNQIRKCLYRAKVGDVIEMIFSGNKPENTGYTGNIESFKVVSAGPGRPPCIRATIDGFPEELLTSLICDQFFRIIKNK